MRRLFSRLPMLAAILVPVLIVGCEDDAPSKPKLKARETLRKYTQEVLDANAPLAKQLGQQTDGKIHATDYLSVQADAYRTTVGNIAKMTVQNAMNLYEIPNDTKIKTYDEFMEQIIKKGKPDGLMLPMLPYYQEYGYDAEKHELVVIEFPARKKAMEEQSDRELGRR